MFNTFMKTLSNMHKGGTGYTMSDNLTINTYFTVHVKPALGSTITIQRQLPLAIESIMDLY